MPVRQYTGEISFKIKRSVFSRRGLINLAIQWQLLNGIKQEYEEQLFTMDPWCNIRTTGCEPEQLD